MPIGVGVPPPVPRDLLGPVPLIYLMATLTVIGAAMPKTAVNEHGDARPGEYDICLPAECEERCHMNAVSKTHPMQDTAERQLGAGVLAPLNAHAPLDRLGRGKWRSPLLRQSPDPLTLVATVVLRWRSNVCRPQARMTRLG